MKEGCRPADEEALRTLRERLRDDYRIVAFGCVGGYTGHWNVEEAGRRIEEAQSTRRRCSNYELA